MPRMTLRTPSFCHKPKRAKKKPKELRRPNDGLALPCTAKEEERSVFANRLPVGKPVDAPNTVEQAYRAHRTLIQERQALVGPVQALSPYVQRLAEDALRATAEFCLPLGRELCVEVHQVPFRDDDILGFEMAARRAGYRGRTLLRYVPNGISWHDLGKLPFPVCLPWKDDDIPKLATLAPHDDDLGVLDGCWYLQFEGSPFMCGGMTYGEQVRSLPFLAYLYRTHQSLLTLCDVTDMAFLLALAGWRGDLQGLPVSIVRTQTGAGAGSHACVLYGPKGIEVLKCEDDFRAPYLGIMPAVV